MIVFNLVRSIVGRRITATPLVESNWRIGNRFCLHRSIGIVGFGSHTRRDDRDLLLLLIWVLVLG